MCTGLLVYRGGTFCIKMSFRSLLFLIFLFSPISVVFSQPAKSTISQTSNDIEDLVGLVVEEENLFEDKDGNYYSSDLADIVSEYYAEAVVPESVAEGVLSYLTDVYSLHGYYEKGDWGGKLSRGRKPRRHVYRYVPYKGKLPEYEKADFKIPVDGEITSRYGYRQRFRRFHHGIDVALNEGDTVRSVLPGVVTKTGYEPGGYGRYIIVTHDGGLETVYAHLKISLAQPGDKTEAGSPIGLGGETGNATGPHLHFETRLRGVPYDPSGWFNMAR